MPSSPFRHTDGPDGPDGFRTTLIISIHSPTVVCHDQANRRPLRPSELNRLFATHCFGSSITPEISFQHTGFSSSSQSGGLYGILRLMVRKQDGEGLWPPFSLSK